MLEKIPQEEKDKLTEEQKEYFSLEEYFFGQLEIGKLPNEIISEYEGSKNIFSDIENDIGVNAFFNACYRWGYSSPIVINNEGFYAGLTFFKYIAGLSELSKTRLKVSTEKVRLEKIKERSQSPKRTI